MIDAELLGRLPEAAGAHGHKKRAHVVPVKFAFHAASPLAALRIVFDPLWSIWVYSNQKSIRHIQAQTRNERAQRKLTKVDRK